MMQSMSWTFACGWATCRRQSTPSYTRCSTRRSVRLLYVFYYANARGKMSIYIYIYSLTRLYVRIASSALSLLLSRAKPAFARYSTFDEAVVDAFNNIVYPPVTSLSHAIIARLSKMLNLRLMQRSGASGR